MTKKGNYMKKENLTDEHLIFQDAAKAFFEKEMKPNNEQWKKMEWFREIFGSRQDPIIFLVLMYRKNMEAWA